MQAAGRSCGPTPVGDGGRPGPKTSEAGRYRRGGHLGRGEVRPTARSGHTGRVSTSTRRLLSIGALAVAVGLLVLGALFQADTSPDEPALTGGGAEAPVQQPQAAAPASQPIEGWFPSGGQGAACQEPVGVDLAPGYRASLTVNGVPIPDGELNDPGSAGASLNQVTWGPEADCPRGEVLRPEGNVVEACVWRVEDRPANCTTYRFEFRTL